MEVSAAGRSWLELPAAPEFKRGFFGRAETRRSPNEPGNVLRKHIQNLARSIPPSDPFGIRRKDREIAVPAFRQFAPLHEADFVGELRIFAFVAGEEFGPFMPRF